MSLVYYKFKKTLDELLLSYEIIFIDDGSIDSTFQILKKLKMGNNTIKIIKFTRNFGQSAAFKAGFDIASGDFAITIDGDLQYDSRDIKLLWEAAQQKIDVTCGWRQIDSLSMRVKMLPSSIANLLGAIIFGMKIHDSSCSFRAYSKSFYKNLHLPKGLHRFIPILAKLKGKTIKEVKVLCTQRRKGASKYNFLKFPIAVKDAVLLKIAELFLAGSYQYLFKKNDFVIDECA